MKADILDFFCELLAEIRKVRDGQEKILALLHTDIETAPKEERELHSIRLIDMTTRLRHTLLAGGINYIEDLEKYQKSDMMRFRNFGTKSMRELESLMDYFGVKFQKQESSRVVVTSEEISQYYKMK